MSDEVYLLDMLIAAREAESFIAGLDEAQFSASRLHQWAVVKQFEIIGEAASRGPTVAPGDSLDSDHRDAASPRP